MNISALSEGNFNSTEWINANFKKHLEENSGDKKKPRATDEQALAFINQYVSKLQLYVQQVNYAVEESSQQLVASMPRIAKEAKNLQTEVKQLKNRMSAMREEMSAVQEETGDCMSTLERLNALQTKLQSAKESLQESDGWGNLIGELEDGFERNDLKGVCDKLVALQKSLQAQEQLPGHPERQAQVDDFKNRLEAMASPSVVQCFAESNLEAAQRFVSIFASIKRLPQLQQYYRAVQKNTLLQQWKQTLDLQATESTTQKQHFLSLFYDNLLEHCQRQVKWCAQLFGEGSPDDGQLQPLIVMAELLPSLQPTRDAHILQLMKTSNERLDLLQQYAQVNNNFVMHLNAFISQAGLELSGALTQQLAEAIYEFFHKFIQQYPRLEETQLSTQVDRLIQNQQTASDAVRHLDDSNRKVFEWLGDSVTRCSSITNDLALSKLIGHLEGSIFKRVLENFAKTQRQLSLSVGSSNGRCSSGAVVPSTPNTENWAMLQYTISLLQCLADFQLKLNRFEKLLHERLSSLEGNLQGSMKKPAISIYHTFERSEQKRLLASIADYQQRLVKASSSQVLSLGIFTQIYESLLGHFTETHDITLNILLQPIETHLSVIQPPVEMNTNSPVTVRDMPAFSFAPQECITQIGQYLLTLPQHLEPLLLTPSPLLKQALELCNIKYTQSIPCADVLLSLVVEQCCLMYQSQILQIKSMPQTAAKQLAVDIDYLSNVVEELGLSITVHLSQILTLLKADAENYFALSSGCEPRLVTAIRQMRNIMSTQ